jgi:hypothetical protein
MILHPNIRLRERKTHNASYENHLTQGEVKERGYVPSHSLSHWARLGKGQG